MSRKSLVLLFSLLVAATLNAQEKGDEKNAMQQIERVEIDVTDILSVLSAMNIDLYRFTLNNDSATANHATLYIDEYENGQKISRLKTIDLGRTTSDISLYIRNLSDSSSVLHINVVDDFCSNFYFSLRRVAPEVTRMMYLSRPFRQEYDRSAEHVDVPLVLYGSAWRDEKYGIFRFCGETLLTPYSFKGILQNSPHYFVVGVELDK